ncbi:Protein rax1 [Psilocybe cubensis]|uniref:RGS domain-containing protein n=2 Tax=Psilocybe cubensis TaxID=181762 RepID=A0A8H7XWG5_PSICU|nr:Protein rax1 [Psilocybe cubensis]KAH9475985.1 Protein rax1 [Psilocybe cubensis]
MDDEKRQQDDWANSRKNRLPSFTEVLSRRTRPPVDLFMFYLFLQREGAEDILDFWLDVQQHENLCRAYFKDVRKSGRTIKEDWPQYWDYARRRGSIYGTVVGLSGDGGGTKRSTASTGEMLSEHDKRNLASLGNDEKAGYGGRSTSPRPNTAAGHSENTRVASASPVDDPPRSSTPFSLSGRTPTLFNLRRASRAPTIIPRSAAISRLDLIASAERIFYRYLSPAGNTVNSPENHEIYLPPALRIHSFPLSSSQEPKSQTELALMAQIPDIFHAQKEYCFRAMEQDAFPRFLRSKAFGNLTPISALVRLIAGLIILWIGLAAAFSLIFLDVQPKSKRFFLFIPFFLAVLFLVSHQYELDPILVFFGQSETTPFRTLTIREPYVKKLLMGRAIWVSVLVTAFMTALTLLFWAVPGHRL